MYTKTRRDVVRRSAKRNEAAKVPSILRDHDHTRSFRDLRRSAEKALKLNRSIDLPATRSNEHSHSLPRIPDFLIDFFTRIH